MIKYRIPYIKIGKNLPFCVINHKNYAKGCDTAIMAEALNGKRKGESGKRKGEN